jgi:hypothetical protein
LVAAQRLLCLAAMKQLILLSLVLSSSIASADPYFYSAATADYSVVITQPNGKVEKSKLRGNGAGLSQVYFLLPLGTDSAPFRILDDEDKVVAKGTIGRDDSYLLVPDGDSVKAVFSGKMASDGPKKIVFMNITGESLTIDLEGHEGVGASRGIKPGTSFDLSKAVKVDPKESIFDVIGKNAKGEKVEIQGKASPGRYVLIWKNGNSKLTASSIGRIATSK